MMTLSRYTRNSRGWLAKASVLLALLVILRVIRPHACGYIVGGLWFALILLPTVIANYVSRLLMQQRYGTARRWSALAALLHPFDGYREQPEILRALELSQQGQFPEAETLLTRYRDTDTPLSQTAQAQIYRMNQQWNALLSWLESPRMEEQRLREPTLLLLYLRALGEIGDRDRLLDESRRYAPVLRKLGSGFMQNVQLYAVAFTGDREAVRRLLEGPLQSLAPAAGTFWLATADLSAGKDAEGRRELEKLLSSEDRLLRKAAEWRLSGPPSHAKVAVKPENLTFLESISTELAESETYGDVSPRHVGFLSATGGLIAVNLLVFAVEIWQGGSENLYTLYRLGALDPVAVEHGDYWRLAAAQFLHLGPLHLGMNMIALYFLGPFAEKAFGLKRFLAAYLLSGTAAFGIVTGLTLAGFMRQELSVGASGAIMGIVGMTAAILLRGWRMGGASVARRRLLEVAGIIIFQSLFDVTHPEVSFAGHLSGAACGLIFGWMLMPGDKRV